MNLSSKPKQKADYHLEVLDGEALIYHLNQTKIMYCNRTASIIWQLCQGEYTIAQIINMLSEAYPEAAETMENDVIDTIKQLLACESIEFG